MDSILTVTLRNDGDGIAQSWRQDCVSVLLLNILICLPGVVNPRLKIYGLENVRVVDASVIPLTTGVAIQTSVYVIAEKVWLDRNSDHTF
jgi:hypothetical protein